MTNITLSIEDPVYKKMKSFSEIKWSEFVRKAILKRILELEKLERFNIDESCQTMIASQQVLEKDWDNQYDSRWDNV